MESQGHASGNVFLIINGYVKGRRLLVWNPATPQALRAYNDHTFATEQGAVGVAILVADSELEHTIIEASRKGTGFDWWLGEEEDETFQRKGRLEVSGIRVGSDKQIETRLGRKLNQTSPSDDTGLPAFAIVVEFRRPVARIERK